MGVTVEGFATSTMIGRLTSMRHSAEVVPVLLVHEIAYTTLPTPLVVLATVVREPARECGATLNPYPRAEVAPPHAYESEMVIPLSATGGWHESCAVGAAG